MKTKTFFIIISTILVLAVLPSCKQSTPPEDLPIYENNGDEDILAGGYSIPQLYGVDYGYWLNNTWTALECYDDKSKDFNKKPMLDNSNNVYIAGNMEDNEGNKEYGYWKNGTWCSPDFLKSITVLFMNIDKKGNLCFCFLDADEHLGYILFNEDSKKYATILLKQKSEALGAQITSKPFFDTDGNVYLGGCYMDKNSEVKPCYWKNGTMTPLTKAYEYSDEDVFYISHIYINENNQLFFLQIREIKNSKKIETYCSQSDNSWEKLKFQDYSNFTTIDFFEKDGCLITLVDKDEYYYSSSKSLCYFNNTRSYRLNSTIAFVDFVDFCMTKSNDIYIAVQKDCPTKYQAGYLKNDVYYQLQNPKSEQRSSYTYGIDVNGDNICITGSIYYGQKQACYWKNGQYNKLSNPYGDQFDSAVNSIFEDNSKNLYCAGYCSNGEAYFCGYWKNGIWEKDLLISYDKTNLINAEEYRLFYNSKGDFLIHRAEDQVRFKEKYFFYMRTTNKFVNIPFDVTNVIKGNYGSLYVFIDDKGSIFIPEWLESEGCSYRKISLDGEDTFIKIAYTEEDTQGFDFSSSWLTIHNEDVYSEQFCNWWKNNEKILEHDDCYYYDYMLYNSDDIPVFAGRAYDPADVKDADGCVLFYLVDGNYFYCENPQKSLGPELYNFKITKRGDYLLAGCAVYNTRSWKQENLPGIWTNGIWASLATPYDNPYGICKCLFVSK